MLTKQGDRVMPGAFKRTIAEWQARMARGVRPLFVWSHQWTNPDAYLGPITALRETCKGLEVDFEITAETEAAKQVQYLARGLVNQMSFAYSVLDQERAKDDANELNELDLIEAGPTLVGANDSTDLLVLKGASDASLGSTRRPSGATMRSITWRIDESSPWADARLWNGSRHTRF
jgi:HK97 family phage prohead protease